jgi:hypothetical protein
VNIQDGWLREFSILLRDYQLTIVQPTDIPCTNVLCFSYSTEVLMNYCWTSARQTCTDFMNDKKV